MAHFNKNNEKAIYIPTPTCDISHNCSIPSCDVYHPTHQYCVLSTSEIQKPQLMDEKEILKAEIAQLKSKNKDLNETINSYHNIIRELHNANFELEKILKNTQHKKNYLKNISESINTQYNNFINWLNS